MRVHFPLVLLPLLALGACGDDEDTKDTSDTETPTLLCTEPTVPTCLDTMIMDLSLQTDASDGEVTTTADGDDFVTIVDASAGGSSAASRNPWTYIKFSNSGASRVDVDDQTAAESSMDWDMGLRRYQVRLNGGDGGPSCVSTDKRSGTYADITALPSDARFEMEDFYSDDCTLSMDNYGMSPMYALYGWWDSGDTMGVETTLVPYLVQLADGRVIKLVFEDYYLSGQEACNAGEESGWDSESSGNITLRWRYLE